MGRIGPGELFIIGFLVLIIFGPRRLPELGKSIGETLKNFKASLNEHDEP